MRQYGDVSHASERSLKPVRILPIFQEAFSPSLPPHLADVLIEFGQRVPITQLREHLSRVEPQLAETLGGWATAGAKQAKEALAEIDPRTVDNQALHSRAIDGPWVGAIRLAGANRFHWMVGVAATGTNASKRPLSRFYEGSAQWFAASFFADIVARDSSELPVSIELAASTERNRRLMPYDIRFLWVSRLIAKSLAAEVAAQPERFEGMSFLTEAAVDGFLQFALSGQTWRSFRAQKHPETDGIGRLLAAISVPAGSLGSRSFESLAQSTDLERYPVAAIDDTYLLCGLRECTIHLEQALFESARRTLPTEKDRSDAYEGTVSRALTRTLPTQFEALSPPITIPIVGQPDPHETDFAMASAKLMLLGEAKAYFITNRDDSVMSAFGTQVAKAVGQLEKRLSALAQRRQVRSGSTEHSVDAAAVVRGIAVPLHAYAGGIWAGEALLAIDALHEDISVIPLHPLLYVARAMSDPEDFDAYLRYRSALIAKGVVIHDEGDILRSFIAVPRSSRSRLDQHVGARQERGMLVVHQVAAEDALLTREPPDAGTWKQWLRKIARRDEVLIAHTTTGG